MTNLSIIIPVYNSLKYLNGLINSIKTQVDTFDNFEIIFIDNNSSDGSFEYLKSIENNFIKVFKELHQGPNYARKKGIENANGEYIWFCDSDDIIPAGSLNKIFNKLEEKPDIIIGNFIERNGTLNTISTKKGVNFSDVDGNLKRYKDIVLIKPSLCNKIIRKKLLKSDYFVSTKIGEDLVISASVLMNAQTIVYMDAVIYEYTFNESGLTSSVNIENMKGIVISFDSLFSIAKQEGIYECYKEELNYLAFTHIIYRILRSVMIKNKEERIEIYRFLLNGLERYDYKNTNYYKSNLSFRIANFLITNKSIFFNSLVTFWLKQLFTNVTLNKLFKKLDR